ncbi:MAG TPA: hypothetical protein VFC02_21100 [Anaerolineales bacterium]|nr:hypothetical protein [Anaerolineales bacterium]
MDWKDSNAQAQGSAEGARTRTGSAMGSWNTPRAAYCRRIYYDD